MNLRLHLLKKNELLKFGLLLMTLSSLHVSAQLRYPDAVKYRTGFYNNYYINPDSALIYAQKLSSDPKYASFLRQAIHDDVFIWFSDEVKQKFKEQGLKDKDPGWRKKYDELLRPIYNTLFKMSNDTNEIVANASSPIYLWANVHKIYQGIDDAKELENLGAGTNSSAFKDKHQVVLSTSHNPAHLVKTKQFVQAFTTKQKNQKNLYKDKIATYALLMYKDIANDKNFKIQADQLLSMTMEATLGAVQDISITTASDTALKERAWNRYLYATANYFKANALARAGDQKSASAYYKTAAAYSPDLIDLRNPTEFFNEVRLFANNNKELFQSAHIEDLKKYGDNGQLLSALTEMAVRNPVDHKAELSAYYAANFGQQESFKIYWRKAINKGLTKAPVLKIEKIDGESFSSEEKAGKWILVDFWGTWCGPCRAEHPALEQLYRKSTSTPSTDLEIITIACNDTIKNVLAYMNEFKYTYPVAMNDQKATKAYNVKGYPTKALITPEGNFMEIPFNSDWVKFIEQYTKD